MDFILSGWCTLYVNIHIRIFSKIDEGAFASFSSFLVPLYQKVKVNIQKPFGSTFNTHHLQLVCE